MNEILLLVIYVIVGLFAGFLPGLFGIGAGVIMVPSLLFLFAQQHFPPEHLMHFATGTSLASIFFLTFVTTWQYHRKGAVQWRVLRYLIPGMIVGVGVGVSIGKALPTRTLTIAFACFCIGLGLKIILRRSDILRGSRVVFPAFLFFVCALFIGGVAGIFGIGGGILLLPFLRKAGFTLPQASGTSAACAFPLGLAGAVSAMLAGESLFDLPPYAVGFVYWPAVVVFVAMGMISVKWGVLLAYYLPQKVLERLFGALLLVVAWRLLLI